MRIGRPRFTAQDLKTTSALSKIIHKLGHEIGNPLTSIISLATLLGRTEPQTLESGKLTSYADAIGSEAWKISGLSEKLVLMLSDRPGAPSRCEVRRVAQKALNRLQRRNEFRRYDIELECGEGVAITTDEELLTWLVSALLENAFLANLHEETIRHEEPPSVILRAKTVAERVEIEIENQRTLRCKVELSELFEPFVTEFPELKRSGIGLTACAAIVERLGGKLELREDTDGSSYRFSSVLLLP